MGVLFLRRCEQSRLILLQVSLIICVITMYGGGSGGGVVDCRQLPKRGLTMKDICHIPGCTCKTESWTFINCTLNITQVRLLQTKKTRTKFNVKQQ